MHWPIVRSTYIFDNKAIHAHLKIKSTAVSFCFCHGTGAFTAKRVCCEMPAVPHKWVCNGTCWLRTWWALVVGFFRFTYAYIQDLSSSSILFRSVRDTKTCNWWKIVVLHVTCLIKNGGKQFGISLERNTSRNSYLQHCVH